MFSPYRKGIGLYNPFEKRKSKLYKEPPPYLDFANLNPDNPEELLEYVNRHGTPLSPPYRRTPVSSPPLLVESLLTQLPTHGINPVFAVQQSIKEIKENILEMREVLKLKSEMKEEFNNSHDPKRLAKFYQMFFQLRKRIMEELEGAKITLELEFDGNNYFFARTCHVENLLQALYATLLEDIASEINICNDPKCGKYFVLEHKGKMYCSHECAVRVAQRMYYRNKERPKRQKAKKSKERREHGKKRS